MHSVAIMTTSMMSYMTVMSSSCDHNLPTCIDADTRIIAEADVADSGLRKGLENGREKVLHWYTSYHIMLGTERGRREGRRREGGWREGGWEGGRRKGGGGREGRREREEGNREGEREEERGRRREGGGGREGTSEERESGKVPASAVLTGSRYCSC